LGYLSELDPHSTYIPPEEIQDTQERLQGALKSNEVVILDRYCFSTIAYQTCKGMNGKAATKIVESAKLVQPDLMILLDVGPEVSSARKQAQKQLDAFEMDVRFQGCVRQEFRSLAKRRFLAKRWAVVNAMGTPDEVFAQVRNEIDRMIK